MDEGRERIWVLQEVRATAFFFALLAFSERKARKKAAAGQQNGKSRFPLGDMIIYQNWHWLSEEDTETDGVGICMERFSS